MSKDEPRPKSENLQIAKITAIQAIVVTFITVIGTGLIGYFIAKWQEPPLQAPRPSVEFITEGDLKKLIDEANSKILASGYLLEGINPNTLADRVRKSDTFTAQIVIVNPLSKKRIICQRDEDEHKTTPRTYADIIQKIQRFNEAREGLPEKSFQLRLSDVYPTMAVFIIDDDLCAYFYPYAGKGNQGPILKFSKYTTSEPAKFFFKHFNSVFDDAVPLTDSQYQSFKTMHLDGNPCSDRGVK